MDTPLINFIHGNTHLVRSSQCNETHTQLLSIIPVESNHPTIHSPLQIGSFTECNIPAPFKLRFVFRWLIKIRRTKLPQWPISEYCLLWLQCPILINVCVTNLRKFYSLVKIITKCQLFKWLSFNKLQVKIQPTRKFPRICNNNILWTHFILYKPAVHWHLWPLFIQYTLVIVLSEINTLSQRRW